tara:strand:+ start:4495 stop:5334 length:840 start_codon:yes stop_codon:yes gene_type:complete
MTGFCPPELRSLYREGRVIPFVGAGASMSVSWKQDGKTVRGPSWSELVDQACILLGIDDPELLSMRGTSLQILEYFRMKKGNHQPLINWLVRRMTPSDDDILSSPIFKNLGSMEECNVFYTTNYDNFIERALKKAGRDVIRVAREADLAKRNLDAQVVKFHGDFDIPEEMVLSEYHYQNRMNFLNPLDMKLRADVLGKAILFIGYSFNDQNVAYLFHLIEQHLDKLPSSPSGNRAYVIYVNPSDFENQLFQARGIQVLPAYGDDKGQAVASVLEAMLAP